MHTHQLKLLVAFPLLFAAGCVDPISNGLFDEDADFLAALPSRERNTVHFEDDAQDTGDVGDDAAAPPAPLPAEGPDLLAMTLSVSTQVNTFIEAVLGNVQFVREYPPTLREHDLRTWGPWALASLDGLNLLVEIRRDGYAEYIWAFDAADGPDGPWSRYLQGEHLAGEPVAQGVGTFTFDLTGLNEKLGEPGRGTLEVEYDNLEGVEFGALIRGYQGSTAEQPLDSDYWYAEDDAGNGAFEYQFQDDVDLTGVAEDVQVRSRWTAERALRSDARIFGGDLWAGEFHYSQCWSATGELLFQTDSLGLLEAVGEETACAFAEAGYPENL